MAKFTLKDQAARPAAQIAKRSKQRLRNKERKTAENMKLETANSKRVRPSEGASLHVPDKSRVPQI